MVARMLNGGSFLAAGSGLACGLARGTGQALAASDVESHGLSTFG